MGHDYGIDLLIRHRRLIPSLVQLTLVDFPGDLLGLHPVAIVYLMAGSGNTANSSTRSYGMSLMRALQPSSGRRVRLARRNI